MGCLLQEHFAVILRGSKAGVGLLLYVLLGKVYFAYLHLSSPVTVTGHETKHRVLVVAGAPQKLGIHCLMSSFLPSLGTN